MSSLSDRIQAAKERLRIPDLWPALNLSGEPPRAGTGVCRSPLRPDRHPSFSVHADGMKWKDHATGDGGDAIDLLAAVEGRQRGDAVKRFLALAGDDYTPPAAGNQSAPQFPDVSALRRPTDAEVIAVANLRRLHPDAVHRMAHFGILRAGYSNGRDVWALVDGPHGERPRLAEIRSMDGSPIPTRDSPDGVKGKTLPGSKKDWPVGASLLDIPRKWTAILLCEGMPDFLAAAHFAHLAGRPDLCPVSILGRSTRSIHPDAISLMAGKRIRMFPHADADGGGEAAAEGWGEMIPDADVDVFDFAGPCGSLRRRDGKPVNDLNDCAVIHPDDAQHLAELLP